MTAIQSGDQVRHATRGIGTVERIERNAFGKVTRASVRFRGVLARVWIEDIAPMQAPTSAHVWPVDDGKIDFDGAAA